MVVLVYILSIQTQKFFLRPDTQLMMILCMREKYLWCEVSPITLMPHHLKF